MTAFGKVLSFIDALQDRQGKTADDLAVALDLNIETTRRWLRELVRGKRIEFVEFRKPEGQHGCGAAAWRWKQ